MLLHRRMLSSAVGMAAQMITFVAFSAGPSVRSFPNVKVETEGFAVVLMPTPGQPVWHGYLGALAPSSAVIGVIVSTASAVFAPAFSSFAIAVAVATFSFKV